MTTIQSVLNNSKIAYQLSDEWNWELKGNAPLSMHLMQYETFGDNTTQHSRAWCTQWADLTDACLSLTKAILAEPNYETWRVLVRDFHESNKEVIDFVQTVVYKENKDQFFSLQFRKLSSSDSKRHDKRWTKVETWMDGTPQACLSILLNGVGTTDWFSKLCWADDLRTAIGYPMWEDYFKPVKDITGDWHQAFQALRSACRALIALDYASRSLESAIHNTTPKVTTETVAA